MNQKKIEARLSRLNVNGIKGQEADYHTLLHHDVPALLTALSTARRDGIRAGKEAAVDASPDIGWSGTQRVAYNEGFQDGVLKYRGAIRALDEAAIVAKLDERE
jgi:hypothetical protein